MFRSCDPSGRIRYKSQSPLFVFALHAIQPLSRTSFVSRANCESAPLLPADDASPFPGTAARTQLADPKTVNVNASIRQWVVLVALILDSCNCHHSAIVLLAAYSMSRFFIRVEPEADSDSQSHDSESCRDSNTPRAHGVYRVRFFTCSPPELRFLGSDCPQQTCGSWHNLTIRIVTRRLSSAVAAWHPACLRIPSECRILVAPPNSETRKRGPSQQQ